MKKHLLHLSFLFSAFTAFGQAENVQLYLPFDALMMDLSGKFRTVTPHGSPTFGTNAKGEAAKALQLNGTNQYLDVDTNFIKGTSSYSALFWFYPTDLVNYHYILHSGAANGYAGFSIGTFYTKPFVTYRSATTTINNNASSINFTLEVDKWYFLAAVFTAPNSLSVYMNGQSVGEFTGVNNPNNSPYDKLFIGAQNESSGNFFKGKLDDLTVLDRSLSAIEVAALYQAVVTGIETEEVASETTCAQLITADGNSVTAPIEANVIDLQGKQYTPSYMNDGKAHFTLKAGLYLVHDAVTHCKSKVVVR